ncbi:LamG-like jellyroll fold domain-containing protein [Nocardioides gansuensis]|uniref:LamG-like jellyroll fold domain-containing protein n=1 Tax=Nocardioides gansuensis TaxID=2138300 RepID=UPI0014021D9A|nr:LamG-like jellyroll fold domain-containing protein [Nocardioides gansuensis]
MTSKTRTLASEGSLAMHFMCLAAILMALLLVPRAAVAAEGDVGYRGFAYGSGAGSGWVDPDLSPTASKPQSKLWFAHGRWWGVLNDPASNDFRIHALDTSTQRWADTGVLVDSRNGSRADTLWDGSNLYVASHLASGSSVSSGVQVTRYSFDNGSWSRDAGFPVTINSGGVEAAVIARDSTGKLWVTFTQSNKVQVVVGQPGGLSWGTPFSPTVPGVSVTTDDISSVAAYDGRISVVWSNQIDDSVYAATHLDSSPPATWVGAKKVIAGPNEADDHINIASVAGNAAGKLFVAVKTGQDDVSDNASAPLIRLLVLGTDEVWRQYVHSRVRDGLTRPIVLVDNQNSMLRVFAAGPNTGGVIYMKATPMGSISFGDGRGEPFIRLASDKNINNPTSTKQNLTAASGLVVLASDQVTGRYVHNTMSLGSPPPPPPAGPVAAFSATPRSGEAPLPVTFTDESTGSPTSWAWTFGDGATSTAQNPSHTYAAPGTYDVSLTVTNANGSDTESRAGLITVGSSEPPPPAGAYQDTVTADAPVGYWRLGDSGTAVSAVAGPTGNAVGGVTSTAGALVGDTDAARAFDGSTGYLSIPSSTGLNVTGDLTVEAWAKANASQSGVVVHKGGSSGYSVWQYRLAMTSGGQWRGTVFVGSSAYAVTAPGSAALGTWTHLVFTRSGSTLSMFVNGALVATSTAPGTLNTTTAILGIGRAGGSATGYFNGSIDEVAVYPHAPSASTVATHFSAGRGGGS